MKDYRVTLFTPRGEASVTVALSAEDADTIEFLTELLNEESADLETGGQITICAA